MEEQCGRNDDDEHCEVACRMSRLSAQHTNIADMYVHVIEERQCHNTSESAFYLHRVQCIIAGEGAGIGICIVRSKSLLSHAARLQAKRNPIELNGKLTALCNPP